MTKYDSLVLGKRHSTEGIRGRKGCVKGEEERKRKKRR
jgi:hypothetical protein